jgi:hypothetical protein
MKLPACENRNKRKETKSKKQKKRKRVGEKIQILIHRILSMKVEADTEKLVA